MPASEEPAPARPAAALPANGSSTPAPPPETADEEAQAKTAAALRKLGSCSTFSPEIRGEANCERQWNAGIGSVDALPIEKRAEYDAVRNRNDDLIATSAKLRAELPNHAGMGQVNAVHFGCTFIGGKRHCSVY